MDTFLSGRKFDRYDDLERRPFEGALKRAQALISAAKDEALGQSFHPELTGAMRYALAGGKGLRAFLVLESARMNGVDTRMSLGPALAIECIHAYSLIHDDLPCMDDDDLRRGQPTVHRKWNEHTAVLAGDALQTLAFDLLCQPGYADPRVQVKLVRTLAIAAGHNGMVGGQMMDIAAESRETPYSLTQIKQVQQGKTGALIRWSARAGALLADANDAKWQALDTYGECLGLAFQIWDDVLDVEGDAEEMGKAVGKDETRGKATFVSHMGLDGAKKYAAELVHNACTALDIYEEQGECLREAARFVISRRV
ncbi:polyprenyl synthetase family protein [uncultured Roseovarius sp.]|uniref:polyprenyl synthetase family protein n=1 Tax=uncultured Roseovarius sp. TaxID=293344 RepID=UPI0025D38C78|nr:farnesyl diphosphate synthase [uncultured Roseovarius sp.]